MILGFEEFNERANITRHSAKKIMADDQPLKTVDFGKVEGNITYYYERNGSFMFPKGKLLLYFLDSDENAEKLRNGEIDLLFFPRPRISFDASPIDDIWKKNPRLKGTNHILGVIDAQIYDTEKMLLVKMMSVRPGFKKNRINSFMIDYILQFKNKECPSYDLAFEDPTEDGLEFIAKYDPSAVIYWTSGARSKNWDKLSHLFTNVKGKERSKFILD